MDLKISKMLKIDTIVIWFWVIFMWLVLISVYWMVATVTDIFAVKIIALVIAGLVGLFNTISLTALRKHLNQNKIQLYSEDINNTEKILAQGNSWDLVKVFDVLFILVLCYVTLLIPILMQGTVLVGSGESSLSYQIDPFTLLLCIFAFVGYMWYMLRNSEKELKGLVNNVYGSKETAINVSTSQKDSSM